MNLIKSHFFLRSLVFVLEEDSSGLGGLLHSKLKNKQRKFWVTTHFGKFPRRKHVMNSRIWTQSLHFLQCSSSNKSDSTRCLRFRRNTENKFSLNGRDSSANTESPVAEV